MFLPMQVHLQIAIVILAFMSMMLSKVPFEVLAMVEV